jgi:endoribonuclease LACTB2
MIRVERYDDVTRIRMSTWRSRSIGYEVSAYLTRHVLVDCGFPDAGRDLGQLLDTLRVEGAVLTHSHEDHAGNVALLARRGIPLDITPASLAELRTGRRIRAYRRFTWGRPRPFTEAFTAFVPQALTAIAAPGHARDHRVLWDADRETLLSADLWLGVHVKLTHHDEDPRQLVRDLHAAADLHPARMFDAHRGPVADPIEALRAKADWLEQTIDVIERRIAQGWSDRAIVRLVLGGDELAGFISRGEYSRGNLVRNVRASAARAHEPVSAA